MPLAPIPASRGLAHTGQKAGSPREKTPQDALTESEGQTEQRSQLKGLGISNPSDTFFATSAQSEGTPRPPPSGLLALSLSSQWLGLKPLLHRVCTRQLCSQVTCLTPSFLGKLRIMPFPPEHFDKDCVHIHIHLDKYNWQTLLQNTLYIAISTIWT